MMASTLFKSQFTLASLDLQYNFLLHEKSIFSRTPSKQVCFMGDLILRVVTYNL